MSPRYLPVFASLLAAAFLGTYLSSLHAEALMRTQAPAVEDVARYAEVSTTSRAAAPSAASRTALIPILVYHIVRPSYPSDSAAVRSLALTPKVFDAEMLHLREAGYHVVRFRDLEAYFASGTPLPALPVIISFDDGWSDQYAYAFPILKKYGYPATFFVFTNAIGHRGFLSWTDLHAMLAAGMDIGDHTRSHPFLTSITDAAQLWSEIDGSKLLLEQELGVPVNEFAYPFGQYDPAIVALVRKAGYKSARGDFYSGSQSSDRLFGLSAMNAPTTTARFTELFPRNGIGACRRAAPAC
ncbi:MAG: polysaccharide deacetylase family protein [Patescibacteria group bacterium]|nr:polysaccharide deacetylase family protein [Patescibacteria group bacterium]MDE1966273.1 polysaccharide deacetylase family protein [Patescibacteria group bacterium]